MSADIVSSVDGIIEDLYESGLDNNTVASCIRDLAAEIVRLRGEVAAVRKEICEAHGNVWIAPAMPNGLEGLVAEWEALIAHPDTSTIMRTTLENVVERLRAADNRDAAGVCSCPSGDGSLRWPCKAHPPEAIAPAEAKGDAYAACCDTPAYCSSVRRCTRMDTPQPADGGAVMRAVFRGGKIAAWEIHRPLADGPVDLYTHPPAAQVQGEAVAEIITGGGIIRLSAGRWLPPKTLLYTHPTGDALGAVRELVAEWRAKANLCADPDPGVQAAGAALEVCADELEAALQHRGDSQEVGRG